MIHVHEKIEAFNAKIKDIKRMNNKISNIRKIQPKDINTQSYK